MRRIWCKGWENEKPKWDDALFIGSVLRELPGGSAGVARTQVEGDRSEEEMRELKLQTSNAPIGFPRRGYAVLPRRGCANGNGLPSRC
ncbi:MAG: hypothetical protein D6728_18345 [Cyanobacteria bacterium J055]|nr:MAG: hypothetical protein D6728_18345 [Cyanobacteria bacterium J055]